MKLLADGTKPLHIQVAEAIGWTVESAAHDHACGRPPKWMDTRSLNVCAVIGPGPDDKFYGIPAYDVDWAATGALIERYRISVENHAEGLTDPHNWSASWHAGSCISFKAVDPLVAVCLLIQYVARCGLEGFPGWDEP